MKHVNCVDYSNNSDTNGTTRRITYVAQTSGNSLNAPYAFGIDTSGASFYKFDTNTGSRVAIVPVGYRGTYKGVAVDKDNNIWVVEYNGTSHSLNHGAVYKFSPVGEIGTLLSSTDVGGYATHITLDVNENAWVETQVMDEFGFDTYYVNKISPSGSLLGTYQIAHCSSGTSLPKGIAADANGNIWVSVYCENKLKKLNSSGTIIGSFDVNLPGEIAVDVNGNILLYSSPSKILKLSQSGVQLAQYSTGFSVKSLAIDINGNIWALNSGGKSVSKFSSAGTLICSYSPLGMMPIDISVDSYGHAWITDTISWTLTEVSSTCGLLHSNNINYIPDDYMGDFIGFAHQYFVLGRR